MKLGFSFSDQITALANRAWSSRSKVSENETRWQEDIEIARFTQPGRRLTDPDDDRQKYSVSEWRFVFWGILILVVGCILIGRSFQLQVVQGRENLLLSEGNRIFIESLPSERGVIYDRRGRILARNDPGIRVTLAYAEVPQDRRTELISRLGALLEMPEADLEEKFNEAQKVPQRTATLKSNLDHDTQLALAALTGELPGVRTAEDVVRKYNDGETFAHVMGYTGEITAEELKDPVFAGYEVGAVLGRQGVELSYENWLRGDPGRRLVETDAVGGSRKIIREQPSRPGDNLFLALDASLQKEATRLLADAVEESGATGGVFIAQKVGTGEILSLVSLPTFDNNLFAKGLNVREYEEILSNPGKRLFNRAISGLYPPGSTIKPVIAAAALQEGVITDTTLISDIPQVIRITSPSGGWEFPDWTLSWGAKPHGLLNVKEAIAESCDIFFYKIGGGYDQGIGLKAQGDGNIEGLGVKKIKIYLSFFGLGSKLGIDLPGEVSGLVPDPIWKEEVTGQPWFLGNTYHLSIGQGDLLATPLQILAFANTLANFGRFVTPRVVTKVVNAEGLVKQSLEPKVLGKIPIDDSYLAMVREGMRLAVTEGIVYPLRGAKVSVAAKTGTAEFGTKNARGEYETHAWVTGFSPFEDPEISFVLLLESGGRSSNAAEAARTIVDWYFENHE